MTGPAGRRPLGRDSEPGADNVPLAGEIRSRAHWHVVMHPSDYNPALLPYRDLPAMIQSISVRARGWDVPHVDSREAPEHGETWIEGRTDWHHHREIWRLYQSGQFVHLKGLSSDWRDRSQVWPADESWRPGQALGVSDTLWTLGEYFTLASRLVLALSDRPSLIVRLRLHGLRGRILTVDDPRRAPFGWSPATSVDVFDSGVHEYGADQLVADHRHLAVATASELFARFGWNPEPALLRENLDELWNLR